MSNADDPLSIGNVGDLSTVDANRLVAIGGSAGSLEPILSIFRRMPSGPDVTYFIVQHIGSSSQQYLAELISRAGLIGAEQARDGEPFRSGRVYVAPPDHHLIVRDGRTFLSRGPRENRTRPAIDPLFRSLAVGYGRRVIGIVMSGMLDDGSAGLAAIKRCGGTTIVQDPTDAAYPDMPESALSSGQIDHTVKADAIPALLNELVTTPLNGLVVDEQKLRDLAREVEVAEKANGTVAIAEELGDRVAQSCPECGGPIWHVHDEDVRRYRCTVGHSYTERSLLAAQDSAIERALWVAVRSLEERTRLLESMARDATKRHHHRIAENYQKRLAETSEHLDQLRRVLLHAD